MRSLVQEKNNAIQLRKKGLSYKDILSKVPVAKSSLSLWLKDLPLTKEEKLALKDRVDKNISRGRIKAAAALHRARLEREKAVYKEAQVEFRKYIKNSLFHVGIALYWAEGSKRNSGFAFTNSDIEMVDVMLLWIERFLGKQRTNIKIRLYTHRAFASENAEKYWADYLKIPLLNFSKTIYKPKGLLVKKRPNYKGCVRIEIYDVNYLLRMRFWQKMLVEYHRNQ